MAIQQRSELVAFDDIPGKLPEGNIPKDADLVQVAQTAIAKLNNLTLDDFTDYAIWRDLLALTGTLRTVYSKTSVFQTLAERSQHKHRSAFSLRPEKPRVGHVLGDVSWADIDISFDTNDNGLVGKAWGIVSLTFCPDGQWRIWMLRTWLENWESHGHPDTIETRPVTNGTIHVNGANGVNGVNGTNGTNGVHASTNGTTDGTVHDDEVLDAVVVGGGQAGLSTAGRLEALGLKYVLIERHNQIGDVWANRYETLRWHTAKEYGNLPFGRTYLPEDDYQLPIARIAEGHRLWALKHGINVRTGTNVESAKYDATTQIWTVTTSSQLDGQQTLKTRNLVLSIGTGHLNPLSPDWATPEKIAASGFTGTIMHSTSYRSSKPWTGKRGIVVGTANTGHDLAEDMANHGLHTTMVQRNPTFIFPAEWLHTAQDIDYNMDIPTELADKICFTQPNIITRESINRIVWHLIKTQPERFDALEKAGFQVDRYGDIYNNIYVRFGGHYVDIGASARIAKGEIKVAAQTVKGLNEKGLLLDDGTQLDADLIVLATGFNHDFRSDAARLVGQEAADQMDHFWGVDKEGEIRGHAKFAGHPHLYYHGGDIRMGRFYSRFVALQIQADALGHPLEPYTE